MVFSRSSVIGFDVTRNKQIIPEYTYPHEETYINDNSAVDLSTTESDDNVIEPPGLVGSL